MDEAPAGAAQGHVYNGIVEEILGPVRDGVERPGHTAALGGIHGQELALLDDGAGDRVVEDALGQHHLDELAHADLALGVLGAELQRHRQSGPGVWREVVEASLAHLPEAASRHRQGDLQGLVVAGAANVEPDGDDAVVVGRLIFDPEGGANRA